MTLCGISYVNTDQRNELFNERLRCVDAEINKLLFKTNEYNECTFAEHEIQRLPSNSFHTIIPYNTNVSCIDKLNVNKLEAKQKLSSPSSSGITSASTSLGQHALNETESFDNKNNDCRNWKLELMKDDISNEKKMNESIAKMIRTCVDDYISNHIQGKVEESMREYVSVLHSQLGELRTQQRQLTSEVTNRVKKIEERQHVLQEAYDTDIQSAKSSLESLRSNVIQAMQRHQEQAVLNNDELKSSITECKLITDRNERRCDEQRRRHECQQQDALTSMEHQLNTWIDEYEKLIRREVEALTTLKKENSSRLDKFDDALTSVLLLASQCAESTERVMQDATQQRSEVRRCALDLNRIEMMLMPLTTTTTTATATRPQSLSNTRKSKIHDQLFVPNTHLTTSSPSKYSVSQEENRYKNDYIDNSNNNNSVIANNIMLAQEVMRLQEEMQNIIERLQMPSQQHNEVERMHVTEHTSEHYRPNQQHHNSNSNSNSNSINVRLNEKNKNVMHNLENNRHTCNVNATRLSQLQQQQQQQQQQESLLLHKTWPLNHLPVNLKRSGQISKNQNNRNDIINNARQQPSLPRSEHYANYATNHIENSHNHANMQLPQQTTSSCFKTTSETELTKLEEKPQYVPAPTSDSESERENLQLSRLALDEGEKK